MIVVPLAFIAMAFALELWHAVSHGKQKRSKTRSQKT
jgi:hypothetical protein